MYNRCLSIDNNTLDKTFLKERLYALKLIKKTAKNSDIKRINGEIKYINGILQASEFSINNEFPII